MIIFALLLHLRHGESDRQLTAIAADILLLR